MPADFHSGWDEPLLLERWLPSAKSLVDSDAALYEWLALPHTACGAGCEGWLRRSPSGFGGILLRTIEPLAATAATIRHQPYDPHRAIQKAMWRGAAHIHPTAHRTARAFPL